MKKYGTGIRLIPPEDMITALAKQTWKKWKDRLEGGVIMEEEPDCENKMQDTVGAVAWHPSSGFASGVSRSSPGFLFCATIYSRFESGGILLKFPGRVGEVSLHRVRLSSV